MIAYFDTSGLIPMVVEESATPRAASLWTAAGRVVSSRLLYPEARAALAQAHRMDRITGRQLRAATTTFEALFEQIDVIEIDDQLARAAGELAEAHRLRGYDAVHLAAAIRVRDANLVLVAGDQALVAAATSVGIATAALD